MDFMIAVLISEKNFLMKSAPPSTPACSMEMIELSVSTTCFARSRANVYNP